MMHTQPKHGGGRASAASQSMLSTDRPVAPAVHATSCSAFVAITMRASPCEPPGLNYLQLPASCAQWGDRINAFRFQIVDGELYVDTSQIPYDREDGRVVWFPGREASLFFSK